MQSLPASLTIAGTDPSGGAGIQADLKTFEEIKSYGMSVITSVIAQNTTGVQMVQHMPQSLIEQQIIAITEDIPFQAFKTGMLANTDIMESVFKQISGLSIPYVMDPVMVTTSGDTLISEDAREYLRDRLFPKTTIITPNIPEAEVITDMTIKTSEDMQEAAKYIVVDLKAGAALITGGHITGDAIDILYDGNAVYTFTADRIDTNNTHGTGCTYSAAITAYLSQGFSLTEAVSHAKDYVTSAIQNALSIGYGSGPTNHWAHRSK